MSEKLWNLLRDLLLEGIFPATCQGCQLPGKWLCDRCLQELPLMPEDQPEPPNGAERTLTFGWYRNPVWRKLLTALKYQSAFCLEQSFVDIVKRVRRERKAPWPWAGEETMRVMAIPSDPQRIRVRGLDHTQFLARLIRQHLIPWAEPSVSLKRQRATQRHANLPPDQRRVMSVRGAFVCLEPITSPVLLVDDILTTGATLEEAIRILKASGCPRVYVVTFARSLSSLRTDPTSIQHSLLAKI